MKYKNSYKIDIKKLEHYIKYSKKTKLQISNEANTTDRTLRRALNGENINLITIQNLAKVFKTQISNIIKDETFDIDKPPVLFQRIHDVRETLNEIYSIHWANWNDSTKYYPNIYYHYDLRLNENIIEKIDFLSNLLKTDHQEQSRLYKSANLKIDPKQQNEYLLKQNYSLRQISKGNTCLDQLAEEAYVYIGSYRYVSIREFPNYKYTGIGENQRRDIDSYHLSPYSKEMTLIVFSNKKYEQLLLYPDAGLSSKKLNEVYTKIIEEKERKANIKECKLFLEAFLKNDDLEIDNRGAWMEDNKYFPLCIWENFNQDIYELNLPSFDINIHKYRGDIIPVEEPGEKKRRQL